METTRSGLATVAALSFAAMLFVQTQACSSNNDAPDGDADVDGDGDGDTDADLDADESDPDADDAGHSDSGPDASDGSSGDVDPDGPIVVDGDVDVEEDGGTWTCRITYCDDHLLECGDCEDNDGDGFVDSHDRECLGPCDNTEGPALLAGVGGESGGPCLADCYFDFGNGSGNDDCHWDSRCDPRAVAPRFDPEGDRCEYDEDRVGGRTCPSPQSDQCLEICMPLTPNGCDCFGCCAFAALEGRPEDEGGEFVWLGSVFDGTNDGSCTFDDVLDRTLCRPCTPDRSCFNDCGPCEICLGREELPPECFDDDPDGGPSDGGPSDGGPSDGGPSDGGSTTDGGGFPGPRCDEGVQPCGLPGDEPCEPGFYCITGCCQFTLM